MLFQNRTSQALALVAGLLIIAPSAANAQVTRGPYVQLGTSSSVVVVWRSLLPTTGKVWYGTSPAALDQTVSGTGSATQHEVLVGGLQPGTRYYYAVGSGSTKVAGGDDTYFFETAPLPGSKTPFRAWVVGDSGTGGVGQAAVRDAMLSATEDSGRPDIYLHMGDMAYSDGEDWEFQLRYFSVYDAVIRNTVCWATMGNHEGHTANSATEEGGYYDAYVLPRDGQAGGVPSGTEAYYSFDYANVHFVVLDSHGTPRDPDGAMLTWLAQDLQDTQQDWIIAIWHHPPYTKGSHDSDAEGALIEMRENALPILEAGGVDLVLGGHSHIYERSFLVDGAYDTPTTAAGKIVDSGDGKPQGDGAYVKGDGPHEGTVYVVAGHGGASMKKIGLHPLMYFAETEFGSCFLDVDGSTLTLTNLRADGVVSDHFTLIKGAALLVISPNGGEAWGGGQTVEIQWTTSGNVPAVNIELSLDDGAVWTPLVQNLGNTGSWSWEVSGALTDEALIRVSDASNTLISDVSDGTFSLSWEAPVPVIEEGALWTFWDKLTAPGVDWIQLDFDDVGWSAGHAQLGYGDGDEATTLTDTNPNLASYYFRHTFSFDSDPIAGYLRVLHDDGVAVWVNGTKVMEKDLALGTDHIVYGGVTVSDGTWTTMSWGADNPFTSGENVVAVLVKQASASSSDVSFDLELVLTPDAPPQQPDPGPEMTMAEPVAEPVIAEPVIAEPVVEEPSQVEMVVEVMGAEPLETDVGGNGEVNGAEIPVPSAEPTDTGSTSGTSSGGNSSGGCTAGGPSGPGRVPLTVPLILALGLLLLMRRQRA